MEIITDKEKIKSVLERGVEQIIDRERLEKKLKSGKKLRIKLGIDPTSPNIHLGRSIPLLKLKDFQELGHTIVFIVGDFTAVIGDTSDKESERPMLSEEEVKKNLKTYISQVSKIIDIEKAEVYKNSKWLGELDFTDISRLADLFSINQFISRENIKRRMDKGKRVSLREVIYPLMQGYDSVEVKSDVEVGGTDQYFNLLSGRDIQRFYNQEPQDIITNPLIEGLDGKKMSSSAGNTVNLLSGPKDMFGKIMSLEDKFIIKYFNLLTRIDFEKIKEYEKSLKEGINPRDIKMDLAFELVRMYHSKEEAKKAKDYFINTFTKKETPKDLEEFRPEEYDLVSILSHSKMTSSKSEARRVIEQGGVKVDEEVIKDINYLVSPGSVIQKGKTNFLKVL